MRLGGFRLRQRPKGEIPGMNFCVWCKTWLPVGEFGVNRSKARGVNNCCKGCKRDENLTNNFNMSAVQFDEMLERQGGACAICGTSEPGGRWGRFHVDHDRSHVGEGILVRGVLCSLCNLGIGDLGHSQDRLLAVLDYLTRQSGA
jgi:hypothetical protein